MCPGGSEDRSRHISQRNVKIQCQIGIPKIKNDVKTWRLGGNITNQMCINEQSRYPCVKSMSINISAAVFFQIQLLQRFMESRCFWEWAVRACAATWSLPSQTWLAFPLSSSSRPGRFCCKLDGLCHVYFAFRCKSIWMKP